MSQRQPLKPENYIEFKIDDAIHYCHPIPTYDNYYASTLGEIVSTKSKLPKLLKPYNNGNGYFKVRLERIGLYVHRLVAQAFFIWEIAGVDKHGNLRGECNHLDGDTSNNKLANLEIVSSKENSEWTQLLRIVEQEKAA